MAAALLLAIVAGVDLALWRFRGIARGATVAAWMAAVLAVGILVGEVPAWGAAGAALGAALWVAARVRFGADVAAGVLAVGAAALVLVEGEPSRGAAIVAASAAVVLLAHAANDVCRDVLVRARRLPEDDAILKAPSHLKGGRLIGPLERWLIAGLAVIGAEAVIVGLMAAKGIGRFPEIQGDRERGSAAEEFLVGSLVSWALAGGAAALVAALWP